MEWALKSHLSVSNNGESMEWLLSEKIFDFVPSFDIILLSQTEKE